MNKPQNITILGGGIMGLMTAYTIANNNNVTIFDPKGFPADNASLMAGGMLAPYSEIEHMDMEWIEAGIKSIDIWRDINLETGFNQNGSLLIAHPEDQYILERFKNHLPTEKQTPQNVQTLEPQIPKSFQSGIFLDEEAHLDPVKTMQALCDHLKDKVTFKTSATSPKGIKTDWIIDCRGINVRDQELRGIKGETLIVKNPEFTLNRPVRMMHPRYPLYIVPRDNHTFMIGATIIESSENAAVSLRSSMELMSALYALHPSFAEAEIIDLKAGIRPSYPDNLPRMTITDNTISCNGLFRHGYLLSPIIANCVHDHLNGAENKYMHLFKTEQKNEKAAA